MAGIKTQVGEELTTDLLTGAAAAPSWYVSWGTGNATPVKGDVDLAAPSAEARVAATVTQPAPDVTQWEALLTSLSAQTIAEYGVFNGAGSGSPPSGGTLFGRLTMSPQLLAINDKIQFTITYEDK